MTISDRTPLSKFSGEPEAEAEGEDRHVRREDERFNRLQEGDRCSWTIVGV